METRTRENFVDLWRFVAILMIMGHHQYHVGARGYPFAMGWVFVEFFFALTGYLTTAHFAHSQPMCLAEQSKKAVCYTIKKFKHFLPFVWLAIILEYAFHFAADFQSMLSNLPETVSWLAKLPLEMLLISSSYTKPELVPLWYLSAMFIVFPLFCLLLQLCNKYLLTIISLLIPIIFYGAAGVADNWTFPLNLCRAFSAMLLGTLVYVLNDLFLNNFYSKVCKPLLTAVQFVCFILPLLACYFDIHSMLRVILLCFVAGLSITFSGQSATASMKSKIVQYLGQVSMSIYLFHWVIAGIIAKYFGAFPQNVRIILYYIGSVLLSILIHELYHRLQKKRLLYSHVS